MGLEWMPRDNEVRNHSLFGDEYWGTFDDAHVLFMKKNHFLMVMVTL